jgi:hypothetical protein
MLPRIGGWDSLSQAKIFVESRGFFYAFLSQIKYKISSLVYKYFHFEEADRLANEGSKMKQDKKALSCNAVKSHVCTTELYHTGKRIEPFSYKGE